MPDQSYFKSKKLSGNKVFLILQTTLICSYALFVSVVLDCNEDLCRQIKLSSINRASHEKCKFNQNMHLSSWKYFNLL